MAFDTEQGIPFLQMVSLVSVNIRFSQLHTVCPAIENIDFIGFLYVLLW